MHTSRKALIVFSCLLITIFLPVHAAGGLAGWGRLSMQGSIIDTACAIAVDSREQSIDMGVIPLADIIRDGQGHSKPFSIDLINCVLDHPGKADWKHFQVTFDGDPEGDLFGVRGGASGVGLQISDSQGNIVSPGKALPLVDIIPGAMQLNYSLKLVANNHTLKSGDYFSSIRFKVDYF
ncbi:fimbrial protein [Serratia proteamaculans]|uniref:fimbrial protein n=1 Tax=Serratia proteamaculans TaxID=28151 RepID=UPI00217C9EA7|nr:fimbrial protein [Serratia proteamaculans]CAI1540145.1 PAP fimbrial minor pilin protein precursor [Serratia proteamaculans]CAI1784180.1 PAP fimbrial minor pilin protein precursor [Serratia proteamaculans]